MKANFQKANVPLWQIFKIAYRNTYRNQRRSLITMSSIIFAALLISFTRFFSYGTHQETIWQAIGLTSGYIQVAANGWLKERRLERALEVSKELLATLKVPGVDVISPRILGNALISFKEASRFISILSAKPELEEKITTINQRILIGKFLSQKVSPRKEIVTSFSNKSKIESYEIVLGKSLAENLGVQIGSVISLVTSQFDGSVGAISCHVVGLFQANDTYLDTSRAYITLSAGEELFGTSVGGIVRYTSIALGVKDNRTSEEVYRILARKYPIPHIKNGIAQEDSDNYDPMVHKWEELIPGVLQLIVLDQISGELTLAFLILIMSFGVLNTIQMSIHERIREFGVMMAIGIKARVLLKMVLMELLILLIPGILIGALLGSGISYYFELNPIILKGEDAEMFASSGFAPVLRTIVDLRELWIGVLSLVLPTCIFSYIAARRILKLEPVKAIQTI